jgi:hypothetical protein
MTSIFNSKMKANAQEGGGLDTIAPAKLAKGRPGFNINTAMIFVTGKNYGSTYSEAAKGEVNGNYPSSPYGPSMTAFRGGSLY